MANIIGNILDKIFPGNAEDIRRKRIAEQLLIDKARGENTPIGELFNIPSPEEDRAARLENAKNNEYLKKLFDESVISIPPGPQDRRRPGEEDTVQVTDTSPIETKRFTPTPFVSPREQAIKKVEELGLPREMLRFTPEQFQTFTSSVHNLTPKISDSDQMVTATVPDSIATDGIVKPGQRLTRGSLLLAGRAGAARISARGQGERQAKALEQQKALAEASKFQTLLLGLDTRLANPNLPEGERKVLQPQRDALAAQLGIIITREPGIFDYLTDAGKDIVNKYFGITPGGKITVDINGTSGSNIGGSTTGQVITVREADGSEGTFTSEENAKRYLRDNPGARIVPTKSR